MIERCDAGENGVVPTRTWEKSMDKRRVWGVKRPIWRMDVDTTHDKMLFDDVNVRSAKLSLIDLGVHISPRTW